MRRIITLIALLGMFVSATAQTNELVTLDHEGELTFYDGIYPLTRALEAAADGDKIYLSSGNFVGPNSITIDKAVSIIGNGYDSRIIPSVNIKFSVPKTYTSPAFEGVHLTSLVAEQTDSVSPSIEIRTCKIDELRVMKFRSVKVDRCYIGYYYNSDLYICNDVMIKNSKINGFSGFRVEIVDNCNIEFIKAGKAYPYCISSSIINSSFLHCGYAVTMQNCLIGRKDTFETLEPNKLLLENCYILETDGDVLDDNLDCSLDLVTNGYLGTDGTQVGIYGGEWLPYTENPTTPTVDKAASSVTYDAENNQLKVNVKILE